MIFQSTSPLLTAKIDRKSTI